MLLKGRFEAMLLDSSSDEFNTNYTIFVYITINQIKILKKLILYKELIKNENKPFRSVIFHYFTRLIVLN